MKNICCDIAFVKQSPFIGCDGKEWSDEFLLYHLEKAIKEENYEWAQQIKDEQERRKQTTFEVFLSWKE